MLIYITCVWNVYMYVTFERRQPPLIWRDEVRETLVCLQGSKDL